jgi:hypothetical protein
MDYAGDLTQDTLGLGVYDYSAMRAFYADVVDVRNDGVKVPRAQPATQNEFVGQEMFALVDSVVQPLAQAFVQDQNQNFLHYSQWNNYFHLLNNCQHVDPVAPAGWNESKSGVYDPVFDGHIVRNEVCQRMPVAYTDIDPSTGLRNKPTRANGILHLGGARILDCRPHLGLGRQRHLGLDVAGHRLENVGCSPGRALDLFTADEMSD